MDNAPKYGLIEPRFLRFRNHYKVYFFFFGLLSALAFMYWALLFKEHSWDYLFKEQRSDLYITFSIFFISFSFYFFWLRYKLKRAVQVFSDHLLIHEYKNVQELKFENVESVGMLCWSLFYLKMKDGNKYYFNSSLDRVDYIWEGLMSARPDLMEVEKFEEFRLKLVQYDHHQKRKEWFFRHKLVDAFNWFILPAVFLFVAYIFQSREVVIHQPWMYFFRLFMYSLLVLLFTAFSFSLLLKKFVFDKKLSEQMHSESADKVRNLEFEGLVLQRTKIFQMITASFLFSLVVYSNLNLFSITKIKDHITSFNLKRGNTVLVDNRFNCIKCRYQLQDGDLVVFGRGYIGQVMAREGEFVGEVAHDKSGRNIASENVQEVPAGHIAVRASNGKDLIFVKASELTGKISN